MSDNFFTYYFDLEYVLSSDDDWEDDDWEDEEWEDEIYEANEIYEVHIQIGDYVHEEWILPNHVEEMGLWMHGDINRWRFLPLSSITHVRG